MLEHTIAFLLAFAGCIAASAQAGTTIQLDFDTTSMPAAGNGNPTPPRHSSLTVVLDERAFLVRSADETNV